MEQVNNWKFLSQGTECPHPSVLRIQDNQRLALRRKKAAQWLAELGCSSAAGREGWGTSAGRAEVWHSRRMLA